MTSRKTTLGCLLTIALLASTAHAQNDLAPPPPNVLLLIDTSGSMEYKTSSEDFPVCDDTTNNVSERSRWIDLVEVLTGTIQDYRCSAVDRSHPDFETEFALPGSRAPIDFEYRNPYHRPMSSDCTYGPDTATLDAEANAFAWVPPRTRALGGGACTSPWTQAGDGIIDVYSDVVRFGLMTFDTLPHEGTGYQNGTNPDYESGIEGAWSYFGSAGVAQGHPVGCTESQTIEVGARNAAAPAWEGKLIPFGAAGFPATTRHSRIKDVLRSTRPYGATPIAGMLADAQVFLLEDRPDNASKYISPQEDPFVDGGCREQIIILLTDGEPNLDLRPHCVEGVSEAFCPYKKPEDTVSELKSAGIYTYVIGFASATGAAVDCKDSLALTDADLDANNATGACATTTDPALQACCTLHKIAMAGADPMGDSNRAWFADDRSELREAFAAVLNRQVHPTSRTQPAIGLAGLGSNSDFMKSFRIVTKFVPNRYGLWKADIQRVRYVCDSNNEPTVVTASLSSGDDFVANVENNASSRRFWAAKSAISGAHNHRTIRPGFPTTKTDGLGADSGTVIDQLAAANFVTEISAADLGVDVTPPVECAGLTATECRDLIVQWTVGLPNAAGQNRCPDPSGPSCNLIGDIFHSTPVLVDRPRAVVRDERYDAYAFDHARRPVRMFTSTNDGFLHSFKVASNDNRDPAEDTEVDGLVNNELWAFIPPAVLPQLQSQYPGVHQLLLDGIPIVKDVVATEQTTDGDFLFERSEGDAASASTAVQWRTVLVQSFGSSRPGYFAMDITDVDISATPKEDQARFLWQVTTDASGRPLFGLGGTPLITTVFINDAGVNKEVAVAVLPGGTGSPAVSTKARAIATVSSLPIQSGFTPRSDIWDYGTGSGADRARSLTVVRLDTGELLATFRQDDTELTGTGDSALDTVLRGKTVEAPIDSPITGRPVAFPADVGAVADRIFVGDADGALWRVDVSTDPSEWTMDLFFDGYPAAVYTAGTPAQDGQPIQTPPRISVNAQGHLTVAFATGLQDVLDDNTSTNYIWSLTERPTDDTFATDVNWYQELTGGERVVGPMELLDTNLYFATFAPPGADSTDLCTTGSSKVWSVDYLVPASSSDLSQGGRGDVLTNSSGTANVQFLEASDLGVTGATIFGISIAQQPNCVISTAEDFDDSFMGYGTHSYTSSQRVGKFELVMHTGGVTSGGTGSGGGELTMELPDLANVSTIASWASIVD